MLRLAETSLGFFAPLRMSQFCQIRLPKKFFDSPNGEKPSLPLCGSESTCHWQIDPKVGVKRPPCKRRAQNKLAMLAKCGHDLPHTTNIIGVGLTVEAVVDISIREIYGIRAITAIGSRRPIVIVFKIAYQILIVVEN